MSDLPEQAENLIWEEFWKPILFKDGMLNPEQLKRELYDFYIVMGEVSKVYLEISNGKLSKPTTAAIFIIQEHFDRIDEAVQEALEEYQERYGT